MELKQASSLPNQCRGSTNESAALRGVDLQVCSTTNTLQFCDLADVRRWLGLESGGSIAIMTLAFLVGGDYHSGGERVGLKTAMSCLRYLLRGHRVSN